MAGVNGVQESNNTAAYAGAIGTGAVAGGAGAYYLTKAIKDGNPTDSFVSFATEAERLTGDAKTALEAVVNEKTGAVKEIFKDLGGIKEGTTYTQEAFDAAKGGIKEKLVSVAKYEEAAAKEAVDAIKDVDGLKKLAQAAETKVATSAKIDFIKPLVKDGAFVAPEGATAGQKAIVESLNKSVSSFKWKAAAKWAAIGAAALGIATYIYKKCSGGAAEQPKDVA